jgi:hypothetical protein
MPNLAQHQSNEQTKMLIEGDSKSGKTGSLASLVSAGYRLRILDFDNGLDVLKQFVLRECPDKINNVEYRTLRDDRVSTSEGPKVSGKPRAFITAAKMLDNWKYDDVDLGRPADWGPDCILVLDSLTFMSDAAFDFHEALSGETKSGKHDIRAVYKSAQDAVEHVLAYVTGESFRTNVIVISHVKYMDIEGQIKGYPVAVGSALSPAIPRYFNTVVRYTTKAGGKRVIETVSSTVFDLANPKPFEMEKQLDVEDGLAKIFETLRPKPQIMKPKLRRM